jgi:hypothetical protein
VVWQLRGAVLGRSSYLGVDLKGPSPDLPPREVAIAPYMREAPQALQLLDRMQRFWRDPRPPQDEDWAALLSALLSGAQGPRAQEHGLDLPLLSQRLLDLLRGRGGAELRRCAAPRSALTPPPAGCDDFSEEDRACVAWIWPPDLPEVAPGDLEGLRPPQAPVWEEAWLEKRPEGPWPPHRGAPRLVRMSDIGQAARAGCAARRRRALHLHLAAAGGVVAALGLAALALHRRRRARA